MECEKEEFSAGGFPRGVTQTTLHKCRWATSSGTLNKLIK